LAAASGSKWEVRLVNRYVAVQAFKDLQADGYMMLVQDAGHENSTERSLEDLLRTIGN